MPPNTTCSGRLGICDIYRHFLVVEPVETLASKRIHARPTAINANRWAAYSATRANNIQGQVTKMNVDSAHKSRWEISEVVFGIPFLISIAIQFVVPFSLPQGILRQVLIPVGTALIIVGIGFIVLARRELAQYNQPTDPGFPTSKVVNTGVFSISRNPLYLGIINTFIGIALAFNFFWVLVLLIPAIILCHSVLVVPEERYLRSKFGREYLLYASSVNRWLGHK